MKKIHLLVITLLILCSSRANAGQPIINLSVGGEVAPGVYGQVQFGNAPPPAVVYEKPQIVFQQQEGEMRKPIYLHVPPEHAKNWANHCRQYNACNRPVYFVKSREYASDYDARKEEHHGEGRRDGEHHGEGRGNDEQRRDEGRGNEQRRDESRGDEKRRDEGRGEERSDDRRN